MAKIFLFAGQRFGRFGGLLFVLPAIILFAGWLTLLDIHVGWFIAAGFAAIPMATMAVAFLVGMVVAGFSRSRVTGVSRTEAPGLWALWEQVVGPKRAAKTTILLDDDLNASVYIERPYFGLIGDRAFLSIGVPLLAATDRDALASILAHENAHLQHRDTNGSLRLAEFEKTFLFVFQHADPEETISGKLLYSLLGWLAPSVRKERSRLSREAELAADRRAAMNGGADQMARGLAIVGAASEFAAETVYEPVRREMMGAMTAPRPPLDRLLEALPLLADGERMKRYASEALSRPHEPDSSHPSTRDRLEALGYSGLPDVSPVIHPALFEMLDVTFANGLIADMNERWVSEANDYLQ